MIRATLAAVHDGSRAACAVVGLERPIVVVFDAGSLDAGLAGVEAAIAAAPDGERIELRIADVVLAWCLTGRARPERHRARLARIMSALSTRGVVVTEVGADDPVVLRARQLAGEALDAMPRSAGAR